jgi:hypothetical protein
MMISLTVHPVSLFSAYEETAIPTEVYGCCILLLPCSDAARELIPLTRPPAFVSNVYFYLYILHTDVTVTN